MESNQYSTEQIEQKRLLALERLKERQQNSRKSPTVSTSPNFSKNDINKNGNSPTVTNNFNKSFGIYQNFQHKSVIKTNSPSPRFNPITADRFFNKINQTDIVMAYVEMISHNKFKVETLKYSDKIVNVFKTIPSRYYDQSTKTWNFNINDYDLLIGKLDKMKSDVILNKVPTFVLQSFKKFLANEQKKTEADLSTIDEALVTMLMPFQKEGVCYGISKNGRCMIADDMGLGKTIQALGIAHYYKNHWPLLIVTPSSVRYQWSDSIFRFLPSVPSQSVQHFNGKKDYLKNEQITIVSYDALTRNIETFQNCSFGVLILDESHFLKNYKSNRTKAVSSIAKNVGHVILLSGTPALSRPIELYTQMKLVMPKFMDFQDYGIRYCDGKRSAFGWDFKGSSYLQELQLLLNCWGLIRRLKSDVMDQLPSKIREVVILDPNLVKSESKAMKLAKSKSFYTKTMSRSELHSALLLYYSETSKEKKNAVCNYLSDVLESQQKFLIFAHHKVMINAISELLDSKKIGYIKIDGATSPEQRKLFVDTFQEKDNVLVAVLSINAANAGITLTAASLVIFAELSWNPGILSQAEDRAHRIGQTNTVVIRYLLAQNTVDDYMWPMLQKKSVVLNQVGLEQNMDVDLTDMRNLKPVERFTLDGFVESFNNKRVKTESVNSTLYCTCNENNIALAEKSIVSPQSSLKSCGGSQKILKDGQFTLDSFIEINERIPNSGSTTECDDLILRDASSDNMNTLLDIDDTAFDQIDLDNFVL